jgi:energy-converting hydrogenase Eha subunit H
MINKTLRWILFLPLALLVVIIAGWLLKYFNQFSMWMMGYSEDSFFSRIYNSITTAVVISFVFINVGAHIVPKYKNHVAWFLAIILNIAFIGELLVVKDFNGYSAFFLVLLLLSSIITVSKIVNPDD